MTPLVGASRSHEAPSLVKEILDCCRSVPSVPPVVGFKKLSTSACTPKRDAFGPAGRVLRATHLAALLGPALLQHRRLPLSRRAGGSPPPPPPLSSSNRLRCTLASRLQNPAAPTRTAWTVLATLRIPLVFLKTLEALLRAAVGLSAVRPLPWSACCRCRAQGCGIL